MTDNRLQSAIARVLKRISPKGTLWWDVATFAPRGHVCWTCGRRSLVERTHLLHECRDSV